MGSMKSLSGIPGNDWSTCRGPIWERSVDETAFVSKQISGMRTGIPFRKPLKQAVELLQIICRCR